MVDSRVYVAAGNGDFNLASAGNSSQEAVVAQPSVTRLPP